MPFGAAIIRTPSRSCVEKWSPLRSSALVAGAEQRLAGKVSESLEHHSLRLSSPVYVQAACAGDSSARSNRATNGSGNGSLVISRREAAMNTADAEARAQIRQFMPPLTIIVISLPLVLGLIPRNGFYGIRVREAFASDANWYAINRLGSIALIGACLVWMAAAAYAPRRFVKPVGIAAVVLTLAALALTQGWTL
jgi:hypothetical protein